jgi:arginine N-succinyltransferase
MTRYEIRAARPEDEEDLLALARYLNSVNLPHDRDHIHRLLDHAAKSFAGEIRSPRQRKYVFVLRDLERQAAVGTSMIVAQLGRRDAPYIYLDVLDEEKYSRTLDTHFHHTVLRLGFSYDGPTEVGGLVVAPEHRRAKEKLGLLISYVRFLYIATHRDLFRDEILAELLPPLEPDGTSHLWEALGRRFTGMSYADADRLSSENKDFVRDLFPSGSIYASLFSAEAQAVVGKVGPETRGVEKMLRRIGFRYADRIDPFDGGPHFVAGADEISLIQRTRRARVAGPLDATEAASSSIIGRDLDPPVYFRAVQARSTFDSAGGVRVDSGALEHIEAKEGDELFCLPLGD